MNNYNESAISVRRPTLQLSGLRAYSFQVALIFAAIALPAIAHLTGAPVRFLLPMHWCVILAGLVYGWRSGALIGLMAPFVSYLLSGLPLPINLPSMTLELFTYGLVAGFLRERTGLNAWLSVAIALVAGRLVFIGFVLLGNPITNHLAHLQAALLPGLVAGLGQIALLPILANWWVRQEKSGRINKEDQR